MWIEESRSVGSEASVFLIDAWKELFNGYTPESYQPRLHNVPSLVGELVEVAHYWNRDDRFQHHIKNIQDELKATILSETDILCRIPTYESRCKLLSEATSPLTIISGGKILEESRNHYLQAFELTAKAAVSLLPKNKSMSMQNLRRLATIAFQDGKEDDDVLVDSAVVQGKSHVEIFVELLNITNHGRQTYRCILSVIGKIETIHSIVRKQGYSTVSNDSLPKDYLASFISNKSQVLHVRLEVTSSSIRHAVAKAKTKLGLDLGIASLYTNPESLRLHHVALVTCDGINRIFVQSEQAFRRLKPRSRAKLDIRDAVKLLDSEQVDVRILAAIEQLALASASYDTRTRFVNLWSALETLAGANEGKTTLERVKQLLVPLIVSRHVHRRVRYLTILCQKYAQKNNTFSLGPGFKEKNISTVDMLRTLCSPKCDERIVGLLRFADHPLLRFRIYQEWGRLHDSNNLKQDLNQSHKRLNWHLARIYRVRNSLVHDGKQDRFLVPLLDNMQYYLSTLVQRLIHEVKQHTSWTVRDVVEFWNGRMQHQLSRLDGKTQTLTTSDFLEDVESEILWK